MAPDDLRVAVRETHKAVRNAWVSQALAFRRIQDEELYRDWGFDSWTAYATSDLPGLNNESVRQMQKALSYVEAEEPQMVQSLSNGLTDQVFPGWGSVAKLEALARKARGTDVVDVSDWRSLHNRAFGRDGKIPQDRQINRWCAELGKGIRKLSTNEESKLSESERTLARAGNEAAVLASTLESVGRILRRADFSRVKSHGHRGMVSRLVSLVQALDKAFGTTWVDDTIKKARAPKVREISA
jgi:hypothetical protein